MMGWPAIIARVGNAILSTSTKEVTGGSQQQFSIFNRRLQPWEVEGLIQPLKQQYHSTNKKRRRTKGRP